MIKLGPILNSDLPQLFQWVNDINIMRLAGTYYPVHELNHTEWFNSLIKNKENIVFAIRNENNELVGTCKLYNVSTIHRNAEIAIRIGKDYQGKGYGTKAISNLIEIAFNDYNLHRLYAYIHEDNIASIKSFQKSGMRIESVMKECLFVNGKYKNLVIVSVLKNKNESSNTST
jgi:RimJ/RimL family protein N-acetyltransferase